MTCSCLEWINKTHVFVTQPPSVLQTEAVLRQLNPGARLLRCERSAVDVAEVLGTGRFDMAAAAATAGWQQVEPPQLSHPAGGVPGQDTKASAKTWCQGCADGGWPRDECGSGGNG